MLLVGGIKDNDCGTLICRRRQPCITTEVTLHNDKACHY